MTSTVGSLCTGYGGLEMALALAGESPQWAFAADNDADVSAVLKAWRPSIVNIGDLTLSNPRDLPTVDVITAGFPCQPVSQAGLRLGARDHRWLWPHIRRYVKALEPAEVFLENVEGLVSSHGGALFLGITSDLRRLGYRVRWLVLGACAVGLAHHRHRVFILGARHGDHSVRQVSTLKCGSAGWLLPTLVARDGDSRGPSSALWRAARRQAGRSQGLSLQEALMELPGRSWGDYRHAVKAHAQVHGDPPRPLVMTPGNIPRLSPAFAEWLMGVPAGHVSEVLPRLTALRVLGNGVVPAQAARAYELLRS